MKGTHFPHTILAAAAAMILSFAPARAGDVLITKFDSASDANSWSWEKLVGSGLV